MAGLDSRPQPRALIAPSGRVLDPGVLFVDWRLNMRKLLIALIAAPLFVATLSGCNTMSGFGKDVQKAGDKIEDSADKKK
jgi:entericidin A